jgi:hypothetical protein
VQYLTRVYATITLLSRLKTAKTPLQNFDCAAAFVIEARPIAIHIRFITEMRNGD